MPSDYERIREENILEYGQGTRHLALISDRLYPDQTHFVYELLQNAEDAGASKVAFALFEDHLDVRHDGRVFDERDVKGICGIGEGTKEEDLTKIGKFGIGFKSVYSFTATPAIHSGPEHFEVRHYVRPYSAVVRETGDGCTTLFSFPFDRDDRPPSETHAAIAARLRALGVYTMIFLRSINEITWEDVPAGEHGSYLKEAKRIERVSCARRVTVVGDSEKENEDAQSDCDWLVFDHPVSLPAGDGEVFVEIAFALASDETKGTECVAPIQTAAPLVVFFPTEKDTKLGFLLQGPYQTTPARDNVPKDNTWNALLVQETAQLLVDALHIVRDMGLLTVDFLDVLPLRVSDVPVGSMLRPLYESVRAALASQPLFPAAYGGHISGADAKLASGANLVEVVGDDQLTALFGAPEASRRWLSTEITDGRQPLYDYLTGRQSRYSWQAPTEPLVPGLVVRPPQFVRALECDFLEAQEDDWITRLYGYLLDQKDVWPTLRTIPIVRLEGGTHVLPFNDAGGPAAHLPTDGSVDLAVVSRSVATDQKARKFLVEAFDYAEPDLAAQVIEQVLCKYDGGKHVPPDEHQRDVERVLEAVELRDSPRYRDLLAALRSTPWLLARCAGGGDKAYEVPGRTYLPTEKLKHFFIGNEDACFVDEPDIGQDLLKQLGTRSKPDVTCRGLDSYKRCPHDPVTLRSYWGDHSRGLECFDPDTNIDGLHYALEHVTLERSVYIWNELLPDVVPFLHGTVQKATRQDFSNARSAEQDSVLGKAVKTEAWVPVIDGEFRRSCQCTVDQLHPRLDRRDDLIEALGVKPDPEEVAQKERESKKQWMQRGGLDETLADFLVKHRDEITPDVLMKALDLRRSEENSRPEFPTRAPVDPQRRAGKVGERVDAAAAKTYEPRQRSVRTSSPSNDPGVWLTGLYTNADGQMVCQMCAWEMPFKHRNSDEYYFEAVQIADDLDKEYHALYLALCPLCAAKYRELVKRKGVASEAIAAFLDAVKSKPEGLIVPVDMGREQATVQFVETHLRDLADALRALDSRAQA